MILLGEGCAKTGWLHASLDFRSQIHASGKGTSRFNRRHKLFGHLFAGRYKSLVVDGSDGAYLKRPGCGPGPAGGD